jgi:hypothetical protein
VANIHKKEYAGMAADWESKFTAWSKGPGTTEEEECENAERMVRAAIKAYDPLQRRDIRVFAQGSYRNRTTATWTFACSASTRSIWISVGRRARRRSP